MSNRENTEAIFISNNICLSVLCSNERIKGRLTLMGVFKSGISILYNLGCKFMLSLCIHITDIRNKLFV